MAQAAGISEGAVFRPVRKGGRVVEARLSDAAVASVVKQHARRFGLDHKDYSGHSLRSGFLTSAAVRRVNISGQHERTRARSSSPWR
jgi:hypothetical protein